MSSQKSGRSRKAVETSNIFKFVEEALRRDVFIFRRAKIQTYMVWA